VSIPPRPLTGIRVGLSVSGSEASTSRGFPPDEVNRVTLRVVAALLGQGAGVVFGHDWREDGVMEAVHRFALQMQPVGGSEGEEQAQPLLQNLVPWPDTPHRPPEALSRLAATLRVEQAGLPDELLPYEEQARADPTDPLYAYLRARGLTHLRRRLQERVHARICVGGRVGGSQGRFPGVIEEGLMAVDAGPLYLAGMLGGATAMMIDAVEGGRMPEDFCPDAAVHALYRRRPAGIAEQDERTIPDRRVDRRAAWAAFRAVGVAGLSKRNGLTPKENRALFQTPVLDQVIQLVLRGLGRLDA
jgi:hypothetical protein